jgi:hypothetical protein
MTRGRVGQRQHDAGQGSAIALPHMIACSRLDLGLPFAAAGRDQRHPARTVRSA